MKLIGAKTRMAFGLTCLSVCVILTATTLGLIPDRYTTKVKERISLCKTMGLYLSVLVAQNNQKEAQELLQQFVAGRDDVLSAGIRRKDGRLWVDVGNHAQDWDLPESQGITDSHIKIPFINAKRHWGVLEVTFTPINKPGLAGFVQSPTVRLATFTGISCFVLYVIFLSRILRGMDPSKAVPGRVRSALDVLTEGLVILDQNEQIMLANCALEDILGISAQKLQGQPISQLPWEENSLADGQYPWTHALHEGNSQTGVMLRLQAQDGDWRTFVVNAAPIKNPSNDIMGVMVCLEDVTPLERERSELKKTLVQLEDSRNEISRQNEELQVLATIDPLTACLNRRSFFGKFEVHWNTSRCYNFPLSCIMIDIDHFKHINDEHGHASGDEVLKRISNTLKNMVRDCDAICRYGGEEFCVLLPHADIESAHAASERFRKAVMALEYDGFQVTASFGVSSSGLGANNPQELLQQADKSLYLAKRNGRNQSVRWDEAKRFQTDEATDLTLAASTEAADFHASIPFHAVSALLSSLTYRDSSTAEHCVRVADLCVLMAEGKMPASEVYVLESAGLLHDIGKVGVPDSILLKSDGPLTAEEKKVVNAHENIGVEIIRSTFACPELVETVQHHHLWYDGNPSRPDLPKGKDCSLRARILAIADAYDTMISNRVYRKTRSREEAFAELRRCAGTQFDPNLIEEFIVKVSEQQERNPTSPGQISHETAVSIGQTIESLAYALDKCNGPNLAALAGRLKLTAAKKDLTEISDAAERLEYAATHNAELVQLVKITQELIDLCRTVQRAYMKPLIFKAKDAVGTEA